MPFSSIILPVLALVVGAASLFVDPKNPKRKLIIKVLIMALLFTCGISIYSNYKEYNSSKEEIDWNKKHINELTSIIKAFRTETNSRLNDVFTLINFGWSKTRIQEILSGNQMSRDILTSKEADRERTKLASIAPKEKRQRATIQYFPKNVDKKIVENSLKELGFNLISGRPNLPNTPTNAIWFGENIDIDSVKLVAYTLIRAGIEIKVISPFSSPGGNKSNLIQVGSWKKFIDYPALTIQQIQETVTFSSAF